MTKENDTTRPASSEEAGPHAESEPPAAEAASGDGEEMQTSPFPTPHMESINLSQDREKPRRE